MKRIPGFKNYSATQDGRIWSHNRRPGWVKPSLDRAGYIRYNLVSDSGKRKGLYIHQAVALTYLPNPDDKPFVNHLDHNKANNSVGNLAWCTHLENIRHDWQNKTRQVLRGEQLSSKVTEKIALSIRQLHALGCSQTLIAKKFGISQPTVSQIVLRKTWKHL